MPRNPNKRHCAKEGCRGWAMRGSEFCAPHSGTVPIGPPKGSVNALKHGFYARPETLGLGGEVRRMPSIDDEIALLAARRDMLDRWVLEKLSAGEDVDVMRYVALVAQTGSRIARMMKDRVAIGGQSDPLEELFDAALDEVSERLGVEL